MRKGVSIETLKRSKEFTHKKIALNKDCFSNVCPKKVKYEHKLFSSGMEFNLDRYMKLQFKKPFGSESAKRKRKRSSGRRRKRLTSETPEERELRELEEEERILLKN